MSNAEVERGELVLRGTPSYRAESNTQVRIGAPRCSAGEGEGVRVGDGASNNASTWSVDDVVGWGMERLRIVLGFKGAVHLLFEYKSRRKSRTCRFSLQ